MPKNIKKTNSLKTKPASRPGDEPFRSKCSIARALDVVGDKWTLLLVRDLLWHGKHTFAALQGSAENIPTNILADRLQRLMEWGLVRRELYQQRPPRFEYHLTETGKGLEPALTHILYWGHKTLEGGIPERLRGKAGIG